MRHNHKAVVAAVLAALAIGFALYSIPPIAEIFMRGWGLDPETIEPSPAPFVVSIAGTFLGAYTLSWLIGRLGIEGGAGGAGVGLLLSAAFTTPVLVTHEMFGGVGTGAIAVDAANTVVSGTVMGAILGAWRPGRSPEDAR
jgi:hypothetical protein